MTTTRLSHFKKFQKASTLIKLTTAIAVTSLILTIAIYFTDPVKQLAESNNAKRNTDVVKILNAIHLYSADHEGLYPPGMPAPASPPQNIAKNAADICNSLVPQYLTSLPVDPLEKESGAGTKCTDLYDTNYTVAVAADNTITVSAPATQQPLKAIISVTR